MRKSVMWRGLLALALALLVTAGWCLADEAGEDVADPALEEIVWDTEPFEDPGDEEDLTAGETWDVGVEDPGNVSGEDAGLTETAEPTEAVEPTQPDELVEPTEPIPAEEPTAPVETVEPLAIPFPDVAETADYAQMVAALADMGIFQGDEKGNFNPDAAMTRAEMATVLCRLRELENAGQAAFADVPADHWAAGYIAQATAGGLMTAASDGGFHPAEPVSGQEAVALLAAVSGMEEADIAGGLAGAAGDSLPRSAVARMTYNALS